MHRTFTALIVVALVMMVVFVPVLHDFLAITDPVQANVLVVEGWVRESAAMQEAAEEFKRGRYDVVVTVGVLSPGQERESIQEDSAELAAEQLRKLGVDDYVIEVLAVPNVNGHRTYTSALAVKHWLAHSNVHPKGVNVFTLGTHARKSLILFKRALGEGISVGVIAGTETAYDPERWWFSVTGIYTVLRKTVGYFYAKWWPLSDDLLLPTS